MLTKRTFPKTRQNNIPNMLNQNYIYKRGFGTFVIDRSCTFMGPKFTIRLIETVNLLLHIVGSINRSIQWLLGSF